MDEKRLKTTLFLCKCGPNMADRIDFDALVEWARGEGIDRVETHDLLCSPAGKAFFTEALDGRSTDRVVVAGCSPKMHEKTFRELAEKSGYNLADVDLANIREHCAWVTADPEEAQAKARRLILAAVARSRRSVHLERRATEACTDVLIIGGGVAGIEAALTAAGAGRKVYIVDRDISLGGEVIKTEEVAPNLECAPCVLAPRLDEVKENPNIEVITHAEVTDVVGFFGHFTAKINQRARFVEESCIGCEMCYEACPVEQTSPFHLGLGKWKAIHALFQGSLPAAAVIDPETCLHFQGGDCRACAEACPFESVDFEQQDQVREIQVGAVVVATGFHNHDVSGIERLGYNRLENVHTLPELERMLSSNGPTGGELRRADGSVPESVAVVHCAGSLCADGLPYCSGVCCTTAVKMGELIRHNHPDTEVTNLHSDLVVTGPQARRLYDKAVGGGTRFVRCAELDAAQVAAEGGALIVRAPGVEELRADMVVLATGMEPADGTPALAELLHVELGADGFFVADNDILYPTTASVDGVYLAGCAAGPCSVAESITRGRAAVGDALSRLVPGREIELEIMTSTIDAELCAGCKLCMAVCPYKAVVFDAEARVCRIVESICRGCGTCTASCASGASRAKHFTDEQIYAEIGGLVDG